MVKHKRFSKILASILVFSFLVTLLPLMPIQAAGVEVTIDASTIDSVADRSWQGYTGEYSVGNPGPYGEYFVFRADSQWSWWGWPWEDIWIWHGSSSGTEMDFVYEGTNSAVRFANPLAYNDLRGHGHTVIEVHLDGFLIGTYASADYFSDDSIAACWFEVDSDHNGDPIAAGVHTLTLKHLAGGLGIGAFRYTYDDGSTSSTDPELEGISVTTLPAKTEYAVGEALDLSGMVVTAFYDDGSSEPITDYTTAPPAGTILDAEGLVLVQVFFEDVSDTFLVSVADVPQPVATVINASTYPTSAQGPWRDVQSGDLFDVGTYNWWNDSWGWLYINSAGNSTLGFKFTGHEVWVSATVADWCGQFDVLIDGVLVSNGMIDLAVLGDDFDGIEVFRIGDLEDKEHELTIRVAARAGSTIRFTEFGYISGGLSGPGPIELIPPANPHATRTDVIYPAYRSDITTNMLEVAFYSMNGAYANVYAHKQPDDLNDGTALGTLELVAGNVQIVDNFGIFQFDATEFPYGPVALQIYVYNANDSVRDICYLQLYNKVGVPWRMGLDNAPVNPVTAGLNVTFADDFNQLPITTIDGRGMPNTGAIAADQAHYYASRKPDKDVDLFPLPWAPWETQKGGMFGWAYFADQNGSQYDPFELVDNEYLNIKTEYWPDGVPGAEDYWHQKVTTGFLSSMGFDGSGFTTKGGVEQYLEVRMFTGANPAMWPAFWTLTPSGQLDAQINVWDLMVERLGIDAINYAIANGDWPPLPTQAERNARQAIINELESIYGGGGTSDEIDIVEAYFTNSLSGNSINRGVANIHQWGRNSGINAGRYPTMSNAQLERTGNANVRFRDDARFNNICIGMAWVTFAVHVTKERTTYYFNNIEVWSHNTTAAAWDQGSYFMINGGVSDHFGQPCAYEDWGGDTFGPDAQPMGFTRYGNANYTYVDWVRIYEADPTQAGRIGYTAEANGVDEVETTTTITITLDEPSPQFLTVGKILFDGGSTGAKKVIGGQALKVVSDTVFELELTGIERTGDVTFWINKADIDFEPVTVTVSKSLTDPVTPANIVSLLSPDYRSNISGATELRVSAPGGYTQAYAYFTSAPNAGNPHPLGHTVTVGPVDLNEIGIGTIYIDADDLPNGPVMIRVEAFRDNGTSCDGYFQFFNEGGVEWNAGLNGFDNSIPGLYDPSVALPSFINDL